MKTGCYVVRCLSNCQFFCGFYFGFQCCVPVSSCLFYVCQSGDLLSVKWYIDPWLSSISKSVQQVLTCLQEAAKTSSVQQGRQYRAHAKSSSSDSSQSPPRQRARQYYRCTVTASANSALNMIWAMLIILTLSCRQFILTLN